MARSTETVQLNIKFNLTGFNQLKELSKTLNLFRINLVTLARQAAPLVKALDNIRKQIANSRKELTYSRKSMDQFTNAQKRMEQQTRMLSKGLANSNRGASLFSRTLAAMRDRLARGTGAWSQLIDRVSRFERLVDPIFRAGFRMQMVGNDMYNVGHRTLDALGDVTTAYGDFDLMIARAAGTLELSRDSMAGNINLFDALGDRVLRAANELKFFKPEEVAEATYFWGSTTGQVIESMSDLSALMSALNPIMKVAVLTGSDYGSTIKGIYSILVQYNKSLFEAQDVTEKLLFITQKTAAEFPDLVNSFKMVGPVASAMGVSFESVAKAFGMLSDAGIRGTMAGRALRQLFIQTMRPSGPAIAAWEQLFKMPYQNIVTDKGEFIGLENLIKRIAEQTVNLTQAEKNAFLARISTANMLPVLTSLVARNERAIRGEVNANDDLKYSLDEATDAFDRQWKLVDSSWSATWNSIIRAVDTAKIVLGKILAESFVPLVKSATDAIERMMDWVRQNEDLVKLSGKISALGSVALIAAGMFLRFTGALTTAAASTALVIAGFGPALARFSFFGGFFASLARSIVENWDYLVKRVEGAVKRVVDALGGTEEAGENALTVIRDIGDVFKDITDSVIKQFANALDFLSRVFAGIMRNKQAVDILVALGKAIATTFALKYLAGMLLFIARITGIIAAIKGLGAVKGTFAAIRAEYATTISTMKGGDAAMAASSVGILGRLKAIGGVLLKFIGPVGLIASIGIGFLAQVPFVQDLFRTLLDGFRDVEGEISELEDKLGEFGKRASLQARLVAQQRVSESSEWVSRIKQLEAEAARIRSAPPDIDTGARLFGDSRLTASSIELSRIQAEIKHAQEKAAGEVLRTSEEILSDYQTKFEELNDRIVNSGKLAINWDTFVRATVLTSEGVGFDIATGIIDKLFSEMGAGYAALDPVQLRNKIREQNPELSGFMLSEAVAAIFSQTEHAEALIKQKQAEFRKTWAGTIDILIQPDNLARLSKIGVQKAGDKVTSAVDQAFWDAFMPAILSMSEMLDSPNLDDATRDNVQKIVDAVTGGGQLDLLLGEELDDQAEGVGEVVKKFGNQVVDEVSRGLETSKSNWSKFKSFRKELNEAIENSLKPTQKFRQAMKTLTWEKLIKSLTDPDSDVRNTAILGASNALDVLRQAIEDAGVKGAPELRKIFLNILKDGMPKDVPDDMKQEFINIISLLWPEGNLPKRITKIMKQWGMETAQVYADNTKLEDPEAVAVDNLGKPIINAGNKFIEENPLTAPGIDTPTTEEINTQLSPMVNKFTEKIGSLVPAVAEALQYVPDVMARYGTIAIESLIGGMASMSGQLVDMSRVMGMSIDIGIRQTKLQPTGFKLMNDLAIGMLNRWEAITNVLNSFKRLIQNTMNFSMQAGGFRVGYSWFEGIKRGLDIAYAYARKIALLISRLFVGHSPPPEGPLKDIRVGAKNTFVAMADGIRDAYPELNRAIGGVNTIASYSGPRMGEVRRRSETKFTVDVNVRSPDGSIDRVRSQEIASAIEKSIWDEIDYQVQLGD